MESQSTIALTFVGGGLLATAIIDGLRLHKKVANPHGTRYIIRITVRRQEHAHALRKRYPELLVTTDNKDPRLWTASVPVGHVNGDSKNHGRTVSKSIVFICTQPQFTSGVCEEIRSVMTETSPILITVCPGITIRQLEHWLMQPVRIVRTMPNTPVCERQGATAMFANPLVSKEDIELVKDVFRPISPAVCLLPQEDLLDVAASISGSSPAYFFTLMEMMVNEAVHRGMPAEIASALVKQSAFGSAVLARATDMSLNALRKDVCVPGGSTQKAIDCLLQRNLDETVGAAVECSLAANRAMGENFN